METDKRVNNGGAREGSGRKKSPEVALKKNTTVKINPRYNILARKRHGTLERALMYAAFNGGKSA